MRSIHWAGLLLASCLAGCGGTPPAGESYAVTANPLQLIAGQKNDVEVTIRHTRSERTAADLKYTVQFTGTADTTPEPTSWNVEQKLKPGDAGMNYTGVLSLSPPVEAAPGIREITVTVTPERSAVSTSKLKFQVVHKSH
jgi:hypothetical protein